MTETSKLNYAYDLLYGIKTHEQLQEEVNYLANRLAGIANLRREDGYPLDNYLREVLQLEGSGPGTEGEAVEATRQQKNNA